MSQEHRRQTLVEQSIHSALLEGLNVSSSLRKDSEEYVAGKISANDLVAITRKRLGLANRN